MDTETLSRQSIWVLYILLYIILHSSKVHNCILLHESAFQKKDICCTIDRTKKWRNNKQTILPALHSRSILQYVSTFFYIYIFSVCPLLPVSAYTPSFTGKLQMICIPFVSVHYNKHSAKKSAEGWRRRTIYNISHVHWIKALLYEINYLLGTNSLQKLQNIYI